MVKLIAFFKEVKAEAAKVVWPAPREAAIATALVMFVSLLCAVFFFLVDSAVYKIIHYILGVGN